MQFKPLKKKKQGFWCIFLLIKALVVLLGYAKIWG